MIRKSYIIALSLSLAAATASAAAIQCPHASSFKRLNYNLHWRAENMWLFESSDLHYFVFVEGSRNYSDKALQDAKAKVNNALKNLSAKAKAKVQAGYCIYMGEAFPKVQYPVVGYW